MKLYVVQYPPSSDDPEPSYLAPACFDHIDSNRKFAPIVNLVGEPRIARKFSIPADAEVAIGDIAPSDPIRPTVVEYVPD